MIENTKTLVNQFKQFFKYCVVGISGTFIDLALLYSFVEFAHLNVFIATTLSFLVAVINNYTWNKVWTFKDRSTKYSKQFLQFFLVSCTGLALTLSFMYIFINIIGIWYMIAKALTSLLVLTWNFLANKYWTFSTKACKRY